MSCEKIEKALLFISSFLLLLFILPSNSFAIFNKLNNPIISTGDINEWDNFFIYGPSIIVDNNYYQLWYSGSNGNKRQIGYATSSDSQNFIKEKNNPIVKWNFIRNNDIGIEHPYVIKINDQTKIIYRMWFNNVTSNIQNFELFYSSSNDAVNWSELLSLHFDNTNTSWDSFGKTAPTIIYHEKDNVYKMWYSAKGYYKNNLTWRIGYATSTDGINWIKYPTPVLEPDNTWENRGGGAGIGNPNVIFENNIYHIWYHGDRDIGYASSSDGIHWQKLENPVLSSNNNSSSFDYIRVMDPFVIKKNSIYYMYYTGVDNKGKWQIGLATSDSLPSFTPTPTVFPPTSTPTPSTIPTATPTIVPTVTLFPTPVPNTLFSPIIVIPGLGASWNPGNIFSCSLTESDNWKLAPYVSLYNRLLKTFTKNAGFTLNKDVYLYAYDWRQELSKQGDGLKIFIDDILKDKPLGTKVRLIGHSLGGLVIRSYLDQNRDTHKAEQVITVGTPHSGSVLAYPLWENGEIWSNDNITKIALNQLIIHCRLRRSITTIQNLLPRLLIKTNKESIHDIAPIIGALLPSFDFLRRNGVVSKTTGLIYQNTWLTSHPVPGNTYNTRFQTLSGNNTPTLRFLDIDEPSPKDKSVGNWVDGKPIGDEKSSDGDGTVLDISSRIDNAQNEKIDGDHGAIVSSTQGISKIIQLLGMDKVKPADVETLPEITSERTLALSIDHNATLSLTSSNKTTYTGESNILVLFNPENGSYTLSLSPRETSISHLTVTFISNNNQSKTTIYPITFIKDRSVNFRIQVNQYGSYLSNQIPIRNLSD